MTEQVKVIAKHNGNFHADKVFAAALKHIFSSVELIPTRDLGVIAKADIVLDVGEIYDPEKGRLHHLG